MADPKGTSTHPMPMMFAALTQQGGRCAGGLAADPCFTFFRPGDKPGYGGSSEHLNKVLDPS